jgi:L-seryl-tRNA(Ser) seleniumtransferase
MSDPRDDKLRALPAVGAILKRPRIAELAAARGHRAVADAARDAVADARARVLAGGEAAVTDDDVQSRVAERTNVVPEIVINATGVVVHTNLGRAPIAREAAEAAARVASAYSPLEYDLAEGGRGDRLARTVALLCEVTGAEDAVVVNNNAAAVLLALASCAAGREVVVSRGELVEIGGGFRIPDVLRQSGARLVEVGTTNRTHARDYESAIGDGTALVLKVHPSNFAMVGFTSEVSVADLAKLAHARGVPLLFDAGSGCMPAHALAGEPTIEGALAAGADLVAFSGDKLLGGPQAGIVVGARALVAPMKKHPLLRALRLDKMSLAALNVTLAMWRDTPERVPVARMLHADVSLLDARARAIADAVARDFVHVIACAGRVGGGAAPTSELESRAVRVRVDDADALLARLRGGDPRIVARIDDGAVLLDLRCVFPEDDARVAAGLARAIDPESNR